MIARTAMLPLLLHYALELGIDERIVLHIDHHCGLRADDGIAPDLHARHDAGVDAGLHVPATDGAEEGLARVLCFAFHPRLDRLPIHAAICRDRGGAEAAAGIDDAVADKAGMQLDVVEQQRILDLSAETRMDIAA